MKSAIICSLSGLLLLLIRCGMNDLAGPGTSPQDPPFPRTNSIMPLVQGNTWNYSYTAYDSTGTMIVPHRLNLLYAVNAQYGMQDDSTLIKITMDNYRTEFPAYAYQYEVEESDSGYLLTYRQYQPGERGIYIVGYYHRGAYHLYPLEQLWLAHPANTGMTWQFKSDPLGDTSITVAMEVVSANTSCSFPDPASVSGIRVVDSCYLYKEMSGDLTSFYYYHEKFGAIAYQGYYKGILRTTYILKSFTNEFNRTL
jgi:hypothetical protein